MDAVRRYWADRELGSADLRYETFGNSGWFDPEEFIVRIPRLGVEVAVRAGPLHARGARGRRRGHDVRLPQG